MIVYYIPRENRSSPRPCARVPRGNGAPVYIILYYIISCNIIFYYKVLYYSIS